MNALNSAQDRHDLSLLNHFASGTGVAPNCRDASIPMTSPQIVWTEPPTPIAVPGASRTRDIRPSVVPHHGNPFSNRMGDTLNNSRGFNGNRTAEATVLGHTNPRNNSQRQHIPPSRHPPKRQKTDHASGLESRYFQSGTLGTSGKKGKQPARTRGQTASEPETISDSEDIGQIVPRQAGLDSPDPLDCISKSDLSSVTARRSTSPPHEFEKPSKGGPNRLPTDGVSTHRLQQRLKHRTVDSEILDVDSICSDPIESASEFDRDDAAQARTATARAVTPKGRSDIPPGVVTRNVQAYESQNTPGQQVKVSDEKTPFINLLDKPKISRARGMKPRNQKPSASLAQFNSPLLGETLDPVATSSSGFTLSQKRPAAGPLPLEAWSLGCQLLQDDGEPVAWLSVECPRTRRCILKITASPGMSNGDVFQLDRDFDAMEYTDDNFEWEDDTLAVIKLRSTKSLKIVRKHFEPGTKYKGSVTFKFLRRHANWQNGQAYKELVKILKAQIKKSEAFRGTGAASCWQSIETAAQRISMIPPTAAELISMESPTVAERKSMAPATRSRTSLSRQSPLSAGPANGASTAVQASKQSSASTPPSRTYGAAAERRVTRQSARSSRTSPSPDLDELVLVYPFTGTGAVNITRGDLKRLDDGQYLNDTLIEFGLKVWLDDLRKAQPEIAEQVHVFNSFFYKKLNSKKEVADTYASVRKWTSKVDIFSKKYIIVPINENFHWYLAIIENPSYMLHPPPPQQVRSAPQTRKRKRESDIIVADAGDSELTLEASEPKQASEPPQVPARDVMVLDAESEGDDGREVETMLRFSQSCNITEPDGELSAEDKARSVTHAIIDIDSVELQYPGSEEPMDVDQIPDISVDAEKPFLSRQLPAKLIAIEDDGDGDSSAKPLAVAADDGEESKEELKEDHSSLHDEDEPERNLSAESTPLCYIITFDSLGSRHPGATNRLAKYLQHEAVDKKRYVIDKTTLATAKRAKAPMQKNFCDCGLFVLAFVESFMKDPTRASELVHENSADWYTGGSQELRQMFRNRTIQLSEDWKKERAAKNGGAKEDGSDEKETGAEREKEKEKEKAKLKPPEPEVIGDSDEEITVSEIFPAPKTTNRGGKGGTGGKAQRLRG